jgi:hypothetical protein
MTADKIAKQAVFARVYEYVSGDGTVYWSFTKHPQTVSPPTRLVLQDRLGRPLLQFVNRMRRQGLVGDVTKNNDGVE